MAVDGKPRANDGDKPRDTPSPSLLSGSQERSAKPFLSVVIPTCHRNDYLARLLDLLAPGIQTLAPNCYEVIVADAGVLSTARTMVREKYPWAAWLAAPGKAPGANRNAGAGQARGAWLLFLDDDCLVKPDYLQTYHTLAVSGQYDVIEGMIACPDASDHPLWHCPLNLHGGCFWSGNLALRQTFFATLQGFDENFLRLEDMEFAHRIKTTGGRTVFSKEAVAMHPKQRITWHGYWEKTLETRWRIPYRFKTGQSPALGASLVRAQASLISTEILNRLRRSYHLFIRPMPGFRKSQWFGVVWLWITLPLVLPYLMWWEVKFRRAFSPAQAAIPGRPA